MEAVYGDGRSTQAPTRASAEQANAPDRHMQGLSTGPVAAPQKSTITSSSTVSCTDRDADADDNGVTSAPVLRGSESRAPSCTLRTVADRLGVQLVRRGAPAQEGLSLNVARQSVLPALAHDEEVGHSDEAGRALRAGCKAPELARHLVRNELYNETMNMPQPDDPSAAPTHPQKGLTLRQLADLILSIKPLQEVFAPEVVEHFSRIVAEYPEEEATTPFRKFSSLPRLLSSLGVSFSFQSSQTAFMDIDDHSQRGDDGPAVDGPALNAATGAVGETPGDEQRACHAQPAGTTGEGKGGDMGTLGGCEGNLEARRGSDSQQQAQPRASISAQGHDDRGTHGLAVLKRTASAPADYPSGLSMGDVPGRLHRRVVACKLDNSARSVRDRWVLHSGDMPYENVRSPHPPRAAGHAGEGTAGCKSVATQATAGSLDGETGGTRGQTPAREGGAPSGGTMQATSQRSAGNKDAGGRAGPYQLGEHSSEAHTRKRFMLLELLPIVAQLAVFADGGTLGMWSSSLGCSQSNVLARALFRTAVRIWNEGIGVAALAPLLQFQAMVA